ncbi:solute carrier family 22 member 8 [Plakobranchus ocellatus]|uniref:Solute carrier family 22 member 8 n=1 Tax=Plakobranchus ocellatus TaxID=259542 RepID=A0AAV3ZC32_9GAST|nr:solute carrier family 22 member 8 [Plakobranchus ocellatus]
MLFSVLWLDQDWGRVLTSHQFSKLGRRRCLQIVFAMLGTGVLLAGIFKKLEETSSTDDSVYSLFTLLASLGAMIGASGSFTLIFNYTPEMFPTNNCFDSAGKMLYQNHLQGRKAVFAPNVTIGTCAYVVCLLAFFLPETSKRELPQTISDLQAWFKSNQDNKHSNRRPTEL